MSTTAQAKVDRTLEQMLGTVLAERYRIDRLLGVGGMGAVFRAHHLLLKRDVAVKVLHPKFNRNAQASERFEREAQSVARLEHPNIVQISEFGFSPDGVRYLVMQLLEGCELHTLLGKPLPPRHAVEMALQVLAGLEHAHANGVIHRDLKPENVFVTRDHQGKVVLKLVDFGVAKMLDSDPESAEKNITRAGLIFGTPKYMSPEQAMGAAVDVRTDLYSLGIILYEMLSGRPPLTHEDPVCLVRMQVSVDPPPLDERLPLELRNYVSKLLAKNRQDRFPDAHSARLSLEAIYADMSIDLPAGNELTERAQREWLEASQSGQHAQQSMRAAIRDALATPAPDGPREPSSPSGVDVADLDAAMADDELDLPEGRRSGWRWAIGLTAVFVGALGLAYQYRPQLLAGLPGFKEQSAARAQELASEDHKKTIEAEHDEPSADELAQLDRALLANNQEEAEKRISMLRQRYPQSAAILWRAGKAMAISSKFKDMAAALDLFGEAVQADDALLDDPVFYDELHTLLRNRRLRNKATDFAIEHMGSRGHRFLLGLVNQPIDQPSLDFEDRQRIYEVLERDPESAKLIDRRLQVHRNLLQAKNTETPCVTFRSVLEVMAAGLDPYFLGPLQSVKPPKDKSRGKDAVEQAACDALQGRIDSIRADFESRFGKDPNEAQQVFDDAELAEEGVVAAEADNGDETSPTATIPPPEVVPDSLPTAPAAKPASKKRGKRRVRKSSK